MLAKFQLGVAVFASVRPTCDDKMKYSQTCHKAGICQVLSEISQEVCFRDYEPRSIQNYAGMRHSNAIPSAPLQFPVFCCSLMPRGRGDTPSGLYSPSLSRLIRAVLHRQPKLASHGGFPQIVCAPANVFTTSTRRTPSARCQLHRSGPERVRQRSPSLAMMK